MLIICPWPVVETSYLFRCSVLWGFYTVQQNLFPERTKAAAILQNLVPLKPRCLMLMTEGQFITCVHPPANLSLLALKGGVRGTVNSHGLGTSTVLFSPSI